MACFFRETRRSGKSEVLVLECLRSVFANIRKNMAKPCYIKVWPVVPFQAVPVQAFGLRRWQFLSDSGASEVPPDVERGLIFLFFSGKRSFSFASSFSLEEVALLWQFCRSCPHIKEGKVELDRLSFRPRGNASLN